MLIELIFALLTLVASAFVLLYVSKHAMYSQTEAEEEAHLKRLFGDAWREAKDL
jgi:protein-S-isoprenylcysteine O-methyltransferase Ste14